jgi:hypothetical protein
MVKDRLDSARRPREDEKGLSGQLHDRLAALAEARLAPAVKDSVNQVIRHRLALGNQLMALLTFPLAARAAFRLFEYHCHVLLMDVTVHFLLGSIYT